MGRAPRSTGQAHRLGAPCVRDVGRSTRPSPGTARTAGSPWTSPLPGRRLRTLPGAVLCPLGNLAAPRASGSVLRRALLDGLLLLFATAILTTLLFGQNYLDGLRDETVLWTNGDTLNVLLGAAYGILMVAALSGTLGKLLLGMRIVRTDGSRVSLGTASLRYVAQYASLLLLGVGYLMIAFRRDKRGLHDLICGTAVVIVKG